MKGKAISRRARSRVRRESCVVGDPRHARKLHAREPGDLGHVRGRERAVRRKPTADKSGMHVIEESSGGIVPAKCPNKSVRPLAEGMEGRPLAKENTLQQPCSGLSARVDGCAGCGVCGRES